MPTVNISLLEVTFDMNYPNVHISVDLKEPITGKRLHIESFDLSLNYSQVSIPIDEAPFHGVIDFGLNPASCEIVIGGEIEFKLGLIHKKWTVGPAHIPYATPVAFPKPDWTLTVPTASSEKMQAEINAAGPERKKKVSGPAVDNSPATKIALQSLLSFFGAGGFIADLQAIAKHVSAHRTVGRLAANPELEAGDDEVIMAFGVTTTGGIVVGGGLAFGIYVTTSGDCGLFGTVQLDFGFIAELSAGGMFAEYWPADGQSAMDNFKGSNALIAIDGGEGVSVGLTIAWPANGNDIKPTPCGFALNLGVGGGLPVNLVTAYSYTTTDLHPSFGQVMA